MDEKIAGWIGILAISLAVVVAFLARRSVRTAFEGGDPTFYAPLIYGMMRLGVGYFSYSLSRMSLCPVKKRYSVGIPAYWSVHRRGGCNQCCGRSSITLSITIIAIDAQYTFDRTVLSDV